MTTRDLIVEIDRVLPASPEAVFGALTDPDKFVLWMGPEGSEISMKELNLTLGGRLAFAITMPDGLEYDLFGFYEEIEEPRRLVHSWAMVGDEEISTVVWDLEPHGDGTRLRLTHHGLTRPEEVGQSEAGWGHQLDRLEALFT